MKKPYFYWAFNNQKPTFDPAMTRQRACNLIKTLRKEKRIARVSPFTYRLWTLDRTVYATMKTTYEG